MWKFLVYSLRLRRLEYRIAELPIFLIPMFLTIEDLSAFRSAAFWEGLTAFLFMFVFGDLLNCLVDRDLDAIDKPHLAEAVRGLGTRQVIFQAAMSALAAVVLAAHLSWLYDRWLILPGTVLGLVAGFAYSVPPLRFKGRPIWQLLFYLLGLFAGPMIYTSMLFRPWPTWEVAAVAIGYALLQTGVILVNSAEDFLEDQQLGVRTVIVALGLTRGINLSLVLAMAGAIALMGTFIGLYAERDFASLRFIFLVPFAVSATFVTLSIGRLWLRMRYRDEAYKVREVKRAAKWVPLWITSGALTSLLAAGACFRW